MTATSPQVQQAAASIRSEAEVRAIRARRQLSESFMRAEGESEATIARLATDETAAAMLENERILFSAITNTFWGGK